MAIFRLVGEHEVFMQRAMELARLGLGMTSPNPLVGCVIAKEGRIIGEGWHKKYGDRHAEIHAIESVGDKSLLRGATVYVNLEPCSHHGQTPPCADRLIQIGVQRVVIASQDTHPLVAGKGIEKLRQAGIDVVMGISEKEGRRLNHRFFTSVEQKIPYIILKWAETVDGFIARENYESKWISNEYSRQRVHQWRAEEDAVLVGARTVQLDNPRLSVRDWSGRNPLRVIIDPALRLDKKLNVFDQSQMTLCYNLNRQEEGVNLIHIKLGIDNFLRDLLMDLSRRNIRSMMVEGGAQTLSSFIDKGLWHEGRIFHSTKSFGKGISSPVLRGKLLWEEKIMDDRLSIVLNPELTKT